MIQLLRARAALPADADFQVLYTGRGRMPIVYECRKAGERLIIAANPTLQTASATLALEGITITPRTLWGAEGGFKPEGSSWRIELPPAA